VKKGDPYYYLTELAAKCISKRMQPDIVSEPQTRKHKQGQIIPCMGCRSLLGPIWEERTYPVDTKFFWTEGGTYPYEKFLDERTFESLPNGEYKTGYDEGQYCINFRGNTGWLIKKTDTEVVVKQPMVYGRWNNGVITINLPYVALESREKGVDFYENLDQWLELCRKAMQERVKSCRKIKAKNSPILWMYGALARLEPEQTVGDLMDAHPTRPTVSLGYVGLYETVMALIGESNTTDNGRKLSKEIMKYLNDKLAQWKKEDSIMYAIYGTPEESLTYKFALALRKNFGLIPGITDKDYVVNSYHVDPREEIDAFKKLEIEGEYLALSAGGAVSYVETADLDHNPEAIIKIIQWMHEHIIYAEVNRKIGICKKCGYEGDIELVKTEDGNFKFICPNCGNDDDETLDVTARICGYLGKVNAGNTNKGRLDDIYNRVIHTDIDENKDAQE
jgi:ribonucleoside-triphosphate reductase